MNTDRTEDLEDALEAALLMIEGLMSKSDFESNPMAQYLLRVLTDDGDHSIED